MGEIRQGEGGNRKTWGKRSEKLSIVERRAVDGHPESIKMWGEEVSSIETVPREKYREIGAGWRKIVGAEGFE